MSQIDYKIEETQFLKIYSRYSAKKTDDTTIKLSIVIWKNIGWNPASSLIPWSLNSQIIHIYKHTHIVKYHSQIIVPHYHKTFYVTVLQLTLCILFLYIFLAYKHTQNCKNKSSMSKNVIYSYWINHIINHPQ